MSGGSCDPVEVEKTIWVGIPALNTATVDGQSPSTPTYIDNPAYLVVTAKGFPTSYSWSIENGDGSIYPSGNTCVAYAYPFVIVKATATNVCGSKAIYYFYLQENESPKLPANIQITNQSEGHYFIDFMSHLPNDSLNGLSITDQYGRIIKSYDKNELESNLDLQTGMNLDLSAYPTGILYFSLYFDKNVVTEKIIHW